MSCSTNICTLAIQACAVMALERVPADIRREGGVARMTDPKVSHVTQERRSVVAEKTVCVCVNE